MESPIPVNAKAQQQEQNYKPLVRPFPGFSIEEQKQLDKHIVRSTSQAISRHLRKMKEAYREAKRRIEER